MTTKVFITGVTGYIGGDAMYALFEAHPEYEYSVLVRNTDKGALVAASFPKVRLLYGDLDDESLLEEESSKADVVIHTADSSDNLGAANAIAKGVLKGHSKENPGFWVHTSGTGILCWKDAETGKFGEGPSQPAYDDLDKVSDLTSLPDSAWHRQIDKVVLASSSSGIVNTAIVCPPTIYGTGRGPGNKRSIQVYNLSKVILERGYPLQMGKGLTEWNHVHVHDLSALYVLLVEAAVANKENGAINPELWGQKGYFLAENGYLVWGEVSKRIGEVALSKGYIKTNEMTTVDLEEAKNANIFASLTWGLNSRGHSRRARKFLGWKPSGKSLNDEIPDIVESEARSLGLVTRHAEKAAGKSN